MKVTWLDKLKLQCDVYDLNQNKMKTLSDFKEKQEVFALMQPKWKAKDGHDIIYLNLEPIEDGLSNPYTTWTYGFIPHTPLKPQETRTALLSARASGHLKYSHNGLVWMALYGTGRFLSFTWPSLPWSRSECASGSRTPTPPVSADPRPVSQKRAGNILQQQRIIPQNMYKQSERMGVLCS